VYDQAACLVRHRQSRAVLRVGDHAEELTQPGRQLERLRPIRRGVVADPEGAGQLLESVFDEVLTSQRVRSWRGVNGYCAVPAAATQLEQVVMIDVLHRLGIGQWRLISADRVLAAAITAHPETKQAGWITDIGAEKSEVVFLTGPELTSQTVPVGFATFIDQVRSQLRDQYHCQVSWETAHDLTLRLMHQDALEPDQVTFKQAVRGKDVATSLPRTVTVKGADLVGPLKVLMRELFDDVQLLFARLSTKDLTDGLERGLVVTGGGQFRAWGGFIQQQLDCRVTLSPGHRHDLVSGLCFLAEAG